MNSTRRALLASLLIALTVAAGQALAGVPNIELVTLLVFLSGFLLGMRAGAIVGAVAMGAHSLFNVMGAVVAPMLVVVVFVYAGLGAAGAAVGPAIVRMQSPALQVVVSAASGAACAFVYQLLINLTAYFTFTASDSLIAFVWGGVAFAVVQIVWNGAVFAVALPSTVKVLGRFRGELDGGAS